MGNFHLINNAMKRYVLLSFIQDFRTRNKWASRIIQCGKKKVEQTGDGLFYCLIKLLEVDLMLNLHHHC